MDEQELEYLARRERAERAAAKTAASAAARRIHQQLAESYRERVSSRQQLRAGTDK